VELAGAASALATTLGTRLWPVVQRERDAWLERARHTLGDARFARLWAGGEAMSREQAVTYAMTIGRS